jgi:hypothetical protein
MEPSGRAGGSFPPTVALSGVMAMVILPNSVKKMLIFSGDGSPSPAQ